MFLRVNHKRDGSESVNLPLEARRPYKEAVASDFHSDGSQLIVKLRVSQI